MRASVTRSFGAAAIRFGCLTTADRISRASVNEIEQLNFRGFSFGESMSLAVPPGFSALVESVFRAEGGNAVLELFTEVVETVRV
jgi:hypothetical protein